jgi:lipopolysaccharide transport system permease protein
VSASQQAVPPAAAGPRPVFQIEPSRGLELDLGELWRNRELLFFLVWRDVKVRYKQTALGAAWAIIQPVAAMVVFSLIFGRFANLPSEGVPYPVFVYSGLLAWLYFSQAVSQAGASIVQNVNLVTKVYFPRLIIPTAAVVAPLLDLLVASGVLIGLMAWYGIVPGWHVISLGGFVLLAVVAALGVGLWMSALNVRYRDVPYALPFLLQLWLYASPVIYPIELLPSTWRWVFSLNPMAAVIDGFRWALLNTDPVPVSVLVPGIAVAVGLAVTGLLYFRRVQDHFADVI